MDCVLLYHAHTRESNRVSHLSQKHEDVITKNHSTDVYRLFESMPEETAPIMVRTEHFHKRPRDDNKSWHRKFEQDILRNGDQIEYHDTHITGTINNEPYAVIDGIEGSYREPHKHFLAVGLGLDNEIDAKDMSRSELYDLGEDSAAIGFPHINILSPSTSEKQQILTDLDDEPDIEVLLSRTGGYGFFNRFVNGKTSYGTDVDELASQYGLGTVPELDLHSYTTKGLQYTGITDSSPIENLRDGELNPSDLSEFTRIESKGWSADLLDTVRFLEGHVLPSLGLPHRSPEKIRDLSYSELEQLEAI